MAGTSTRKAEESHRDHHTQRSCLPMRLESLSAKDYMSTQKPNLAYADDFTVWERKPGGLSKSWDGLTMALSKAGLEMKPSKCTITWIPHYHASISEPVIPGIKVDTGLIVLGSPAVDGSEMHLGVPLLDESTLANDPTTGRAD